MTEAYVIGSHGEHHYPTKDEPFYLAGPLNEITKEQAFWHFESLPMFGLSNQDYGDGGFYFHCSEFMSGRVTTQTACFDGRWFRAFVRYTDEATYITKERVAAHDAKIQSGLLPVSLSYYWLDESGKIRDPETSKPYLPVNMSKAVEIASGVETEPNTFQDRAKLFAVGGVLVLSRFVEEWSEDGLGEKIGEREFSTIVHPGSVETLAPAEKEMWHEFYQYSPQMAVNLNSGGFNFTIKAPKDVRLDMAEMYAEIDGVSVNDWLIAAIKEKISARDAMDL